jgi:Zn-dependent protease with chaperone function
MSSNLIKKIEQKKWISLGIFLLVDLVQVLFVSLLDLNSDRPLIVGVDFSRTNPLVSVSLFVTIAFLQIIMIYGVALAMVRRGDMKQIFPEYDSTGEWECTYSRQELTEWTRSAAKECGVEIDKIYLMRSPIPNAFTFSLPLFGSLVALHSNLLDLLAPDEVRAIITHEVAHIRHRDSIVQIILRMPSVFVDTIYVYVYLRLILGIMDSLLVSFDIIVAGIRLAVLLSFILISRVMTLVSRIFIKKAARYAEMMADYLSAEVLGTKSTINALILLGQRVEALSAFTEEIRWLHGLESDNTRGISGSELKRLVEEFPARTIDEEQARLQAPKLYLKQKLERLRQVYALRVDDEIINDMIIPAAKDLTEKRKKEHPEAVQKDRTIDWRQADQDGDFRLSTGEIQDLIRVLRENPKKFLFENEVDANILMLDHPDFRRRVLFLADAFDVERT